MFYSSISTLALIVSTIVNIRVLREKAIERTEAISAYREFLIAASFYYAADAMWGILDQFHLIWPLIIDTDVYFVFMAISIFAWTRYVITLVEGDASFRKLMITGGYGFIIYQVIALVANIFYPVFFWFDESGAYCVGPLRYVGLGLLILMYVGTTYYAVCAYSEASDYGLKEKYSILGWFSAIMILMITIQMSFPLLPFYAIGYLIGTCMINSFVNEMEFIQHNVEMEGMRQIERDQKEEIRSTRSLAYRDALTGVRNSHAYVEATSSIDRSIKSGALSEFAIIFFDLNGLKIVNDTYGHDRGNEYIKEATRLIREHFRHSVLFRVGGDEFVAFLEKSDYDEREDLLKEFNELMDNNVLSGRVVIAAGMGVFDPESDDNYLNIYDRADNLMYKRKQELKELVKAESAESESNRNRSNDAGAGSRFFDEKTLEETRNRQYVIENFEIALKENWIEVFYQPIVRSTNGRVCDEEALARWIDPEKGMLTPDRFIPVLEEAGLIYKLDLYVLKKVIEKIKLFEKEGLTVVPQSVNLSRKDLEASNILDDICRLVDEANVKHNLIIFEITETTAGRNTAFIREKVDSFHAAGFNVWMDDFGSGYSSLDLLQSIDFDLIKFDMQFMRQFNDNEDGKIILAELMRMATSLGVETVCEGVEREDQLEFLREIGCSKIQGYYYTKPISVEAIMERYRQGVQIGFENPEETDYFETISSINLYDLSVLANDEDGSFRNFFNTLPMAIIEVRGNYTRFARCNVSYREFMSRAFHIPIADIDNEFHEIPSEGPGSGFVRNIVECCEEGGRAVVDEKLPDGSIVHSLIRLVSTNPVTDTSAIVVAVLAITENGEGTSYANIARTLASDYFNLFYVDLNTEDFVEYSSDIGSEDISFERHGENFFEASANDAKKFIYEEDVDRFVKIFTKERVVKAIDEQGSFNINYRLKTDIEPVFVTMKAVRMKGETDHIIIGVRNVDTQMRQRITLDKLKEEQMFYNRLKALMGDFVAIYTVDIPSKKYIETSSTTEYGMFGFAKTGDDFFRDTFLNIEKVIPVEELELMREAMTMENMLKTIEEEGIFVIKYHLIMNGERHLMKLRAATVEESDGKKLIVGVNFM